MSRDWPEEIFPGVRETCAEKSEYFSFHHSVFSSFAGSGRLVGSRWVNYRKLPRRQSIPEGRRQPSHFRFSPEKMFQN
jgi:hypothetical protein